jgi:putative FmdB family regulatory protein
MPTYEYVCKRCGHRVEVVQSLSDEPLKTCGVCGGELRKVFHPAGVLFKGSGFYSTDARAKGKEEAASSAAKDSSKGGTDGTDRSSSTGSETGSGSRSGDSTGDRGSGGSTGSGGQARPASSGSRSASREGTSPKPAKDEG